jgi:hypothetical protein
MKTGDIIVLYILIFLLNNNNRTKTVIEMNTVMAIENKK